MTGTRHMDEIASFGYWLRRRRKTLDLTQAALAQLVGCSTATIKKIERDERRPSRQLAELLANHLAIPDEEIKRFIQMARGQFMASMPSPLEVGSPPTFLTTTEETSTPDELLFVARKSELAQLDTHLTKTMVGNGRAIFVTGEAGSGKTTLVQEFADRAQQAHTGLIVAGGNCNAFTGVGDPYLPFREILGLLSGEVEARWSSGAISQEQARRLWALIPQTVQALVTDGPDLLDIFISSQPLLQRTTTAATGGAAWLTRLQQLVAQHEARSAPANLHQSNLFEQYNKVLQALARRQPLLLVLDDLQWADTGSINLLFHLGRQLEGHPILVVGIYRPSDVAQGRPSTPSAGERERHPLEPVVNEFQRAFGDTQLNLSQTEGREFVDRLLDSQPNRLGVEFREALYRQTQGHALFTVEMLRGLQERGDLAQDEQGHWIEGPTLDWQTLPAKVEGVIEERIGRLPGMLQELLKVAAIEGEFFTAEVIARVQNLDEAQVIQQLSGVLDKQHWLVRSQSSQRLGHSGQRLSQYRFRHILFQRYLYRSLDEVERAYLHESVGDALEHLYEGQTEAVAVQLARHFQMAGLMLKAVGYLQQAGDIAVRLSAYQEALTYFYKALELLESLSDSSQHAQQEFSLQIALGQALVVVNGAAAPEVEYRFRRAHELSQQVEDSHQLVQMFWGLFTFSGLRGDKQQSHELAEQFLHLAQSHQDTTLLIGAHTALGTNLLYIGEELALAQVHLEQGLALYELQKHNAFTSLYRQDLGLLCRRYLAWAKWFQGYPDQALKQIHELLINLTKKLAHPYKIAETQAIACMLHYFRREIQTVKEWAEENITLSTNHEFLDWKLHGFMFRSWALVEQEQAEQGIEQMHQNLDAWYATGARWLEPLFLSLLAGAHIRSGQTMEGLTLLRKALTQVELTGERFWEAELYRLKGELLLKAESERMNAVHELTPEDCFYKANEVARRQSAKSLELRATVSLCRLWQAQGKKEEARQMLSDIYGWFTEGFDTLDLQEAKALLDELSGDGE